MRVLGALAALLAALVPAANAACLPPEMILVGIQTANRIQVEQLGSDATRIETPLAHVPGRTLGYEVQGLFRVNGPVAAALQRTFGRRDSYACGDAPPATFETPGSLAIGLLFASGRAAIAAVLHLPEGMVELQLEGGVHTLAPLSQAGQRRWQEVLLLFARETHTSPEEFYEQMLPPVHIDPATPAEPDSTSPPRDGEPAPR